MIELVDESAGLSSFTADGAAASTGSNAEALRTVPVLIASARRSLVAWYRVALATVGLSLTVSPDGLHALMNAVRNPPELVILDDELGGVDADRVEELLGRDARTAATRIVRVKSLLDAPVAGGDEDRDRRANRFPTARS